MANPIQTSSSAVQGTKGTNQSASLQDLMSRLGAQAPGLQGVNANFSQLMAQHRLATADKGASANAQPKPAQPQGKSSEHEIMSRNAEQARSSEQQLARARQQAMLARRGEEQNLLNGDRADVDGVDATGLALAAQDVVDSDISFQTEMGEGSATVRELEPPSDVAVNDPAAMMAWLASMTQGDIRPDLTGAEQLARNEAAAERLQAQMAPGSDADALAAKAAEEAAAEAGASEQGGLQLDPGAWQTMTPTTALQMDALQPGGAKMGDARGGRDLLDGLASLTAARTGSFAPMLDGARPARPESATLGAHLHSAEFGDALAEQVKVWVSSARQSGPMTAQLHLNPADMGPIQVKIAVEGQAAQVDFAAAMPETRQALEASLGKLQDALSDVGLNLTGGSVFAQDAGAGFGQQSHGAAQPEAMPSWARGAGRGEGDDAEVAATLPLTPAVRNGQAGGLDLYA